MTKYVCVIGLFAVHVVLQPPSTGSISGRVVDADTGAPVAGAKVGGRSIGWHPADAQGRFVLTNLPPGSVEISVQESNGGYVAISLTPSRTVAVTAGKETSGVDFRVRLDASASGQVVDGNGDPLPGITVVAVSREYSREGPYGGGEYANGDLWYFRLESATTDDRGRYTIASLHAGRPYRLLAHRPRRYAPAISDAPRDPQSRRPALVPTYFPSANSFETAAPVVLHSLERRENVDIQVTRAPSFCIETVLTKEGTPAAMQFMVEEEDIHRLDSHATTSVSWRTFGRSGGDGRIRVCDLAAGSFRLTAADTINPFEKPGHIATVPISITKEDLRLAPVIAGPLVTIVGEVVWDDKPPAEPQKLPSSIATVPRVDYRPGSRASMGGAPGEFSLQAVPGAHYSLWITRPRPPLYVRDILHDGSSILRSSLVPGPAGSGRLQIRAGHDGGSITARVQDHKGLPAPRTWVWILSTSARSEAELATAMWVGSADDAGLHTARGLPPDTYAVFATDDLPPAIVALPGSTVKVEKTPETMAMLLRARAAAKPVTVRPNGTVDVTVVVRDP